MAVTDHVLRQLAERVGLHLLASQRTVSTAESCTGGWIAKALTDVAGSSAWFGAGFVCYSNEAKQSMLGVSARALRTDGAVSERVVTQLCRGALKASGASMAVAVSGIAGPSGGSKAKPVGTVWVAFAIKQGSKIQVSAQVHRFKGGRDAIRRATTATALRGLLRR
jgi:nicotinamide-nucleotide amidase